MAGRVLSLGSVFRMIVADICRLCPSASMQGLCRVALPQCLGLESGYAKHSEDTAVLGTHVGRTLLSLHGVGRQLTLFSLSTSKRKCAQLNHVSLFL